MANKVANHVDFDQKQAQNFVLHNSASAPGAPVLGQLYTDTDDSKPYFWNGSTWVDLSSTGSPGGAFDPVQAQVFSH